MENTYEKVRLIISEQLNVDIDTIKPETNLLKDLEADSLDFTEIVITIEAAFKVEIPDEEADKILEKATVQEIVDFDKKLQ
jgi:acyl carrier protein